jgi:hypothetical protein
VRALTCSLPLLADWLGLPPLLTAILVLQDPVFIFRFPYFLIISNLSCSGITCSGFPCPRQLGATYPFSVRYKSTFLLMTPIDESIIMILDNAGNE